jgi:hypothetical protein
MARQTTGAETWVDRLVRYLFDLAEPAADLAEPAAEPAREPAAELAGELAGWLTASPRFRAFVESHRDKIRKKLRGATDPEARRDVRAELCTAHLLLADRRMEIAFEAYGSGRAGPDFTVTFRGERSFNLEVTRQRRAPDAGGYAGLLAGKLRQLPPGAPNAILIVVDGVAAAGPAAAPADPAVAAVDGAVRALRNRADRKDEQFFADRGFDGARGFYDRFLRLGGVIVFTEAAFGDGRASLWVNRSARIALPARAVRACVLALQAAGR